MSHVGVCWGTKTGSPKICPHLGLVSVTGPVGTRPSPHQAQFGRCRPNDTGVRKGSQNHLGALEPTVWDGEMTLKTCYYLIYVSMPNLQ